MLGECNLIEFQKFIDRFSYCRSVLTQPAAKALEYFLKSLMYCSYVCICICIISWNLRLSLLLSMVSLFSYIWYIVTWITCLYLNFFLYIFPNQWTPWNMGAVYQLNYYFWSTFTLPINVVLPLHLTLMEAYTSTW